MRARILRINLLALALLLAFSPVAFAGHSYDERGFLGVELDELTPELQEHFGASQGLGVMVSRVEDDSPAWQAGLRVGDVITYIDGESIEDSWDAVRAVRRLAGETVRLEVVRDGKAQQMTAEVGTRERTYRRHGHGYGIVIEGDMEELEEELERLGRQMEGLGEEIGRQVERAFEDVEWDEIGEAVERSLEHSLRALDSLEIEVDLDEMERALERSLEDLEITLEGLEGDLEYEVSGPAT